LDDYIEFYNIACTYLKILLKGSISRSDFRNRYLTGLKYYLDEMEINFYRNCNEWIKQKRLACQIIDKLQENLQLHPDDETLASVEKVMKETDKMRAIWNCVHTEPLCIYDLWKENREIKFDDRRSDERKLLEMFSRFKPCDNFACIQMLNNVTKATEC
jgi:hypothetical protein